MSDGTFEFLKWLYWYYYFISDEMDGIILFIFKKIKFFKNKFKPLTLWTCMMSQKNGTVLKDQSHEAVSIWKKHKLFNEVLKQASVT